MFSDMKIKTLSHHVNGKSTYTKFMHPSIAVGKGVHGEGVICTQDIPMGSILLIEDGLYNIHKTPTKNVIEWKTKLYRQKQEVRTILDTFYHSDKAKQLYDSDDIDIQRFIINSVGGDLYPMLSKINHGYPTNIVIMRSPTHHRFYSKWIKKIKTIAIATDDLSKDDELFYDYFNIINTNHVVDMTEFNINQELHNIHIDPRIYNDFVNSHGQYSFEYRPNSVNDPYYHQMVNVIFDKIYLNGICSSGCFKETDMNRICQRKQEIKEKIFKMEYAMQHQKYGGVFSQIAESKKDPAMYNEIIGQIESQMSSQQLRDLFHLYDIKNKPVLHRYMDKMLGRN
eukprot:1156510_1